MTFIPTSGAVRVDIQFVMAGQQIHNIIWCTRDSPWTQAQRDALNVAIRDWWNATGKAAFSSSIALSQITSVNQDSANAPASTLIVSPAVAGTQGGAAASNHSAAVATLRTDLRGRNYRGRMYLGGLAGDTLSDSITLAASRVAQLISVLGSLKTVIDGLGAIWVVVSHFVNNAPRVSGLKTPITAIAMDQYVDSQRRRLGGRGV
jgi:hypothetical protein